MVTTMKKRKQRPEPPTLAFSATAERLRQRLELRRSSAASKHRNKAKYHRPSEARKRLLDHRNED
jgi:hypothetical protein